MIGLKIGKQIHHNICRCAVWFLLWIQAASNHGLFVSVWWGPWPSWHHSSRERKSWRPQYRCPGSSPNASNRGTWIIGFHVTGFSHFKAAWEKLKRSLASNALPSWQGPRVVVFPWPISGILPSTAKLRAATNGCRLDGGHTTKAEVVQFEALTATRLTCLGMLVVLVGLGTVSDIV